MDVFRGKRIAIVGAAGSALKTGLGKYIDGFDIVVRINKASLLIQSGQHKSDIGTKTDILFHSFYENEFSGGGPLDFRLFDELGISYVINPVQGFLGKRFSFNFYKKYLERRPTYYLPDFVYNSINGKFKPFRPTTGFYALLTLVQSNFKELYITGFTFFKTPYVEGYRDALKDVNVNSKYIKESRQHNPDIELREFKSLLSENRSKTIILDESLKFIVENNL